MNDRIKAETSAHAVVLGRRTINRNPIELLKDLYANIGFSGAVGSCIRIDESMRKRILECIQWHEGRDNAPKS